MQGMKKKKKLKLAVLLEVKEKNAAYSGPRDSP